MSEIDVTLRGTVEGLSEIAAFRKELQEIQDQQTLMNRESILASARNRTQDKLDIQLKQDMQKALDNSFTRRQYEIKQLAIQEKKSAQEADMEFETAFNKSMQRLRDEKAAQDALNESKARGRKFLSEQVGADIDAEFMKRKAEMAAMEREEIVRKQELSAIDANRRQELMQASIGMFVMGIK